MVSGTRWSTSRTNPITAAATDALGHALAAALFPGAFLALRGDLGAGKSSLARALARGLGIEGPVPSPTFSLVQTYETSDITLTHADLYRIDDATATRELDLQGALDAGALLVEWPRFLEGLSPAKHIDITLAFPSDEGEHSCTRIAEIHADGESSDNIRSDIRDFLL